jgi:hypothetical protein
MALRKGLRRKRRTPQSPEHAARVRPGGVHRRDHHPKRSDTVTFAPGDRSNCYSSRCGGW